MTRGLQWKADEVKVLIAKLRPELKDRSIHSYQPNVVVVGRKPVMPRTPDSASDKEKLASRFSHPLTPPSSSKAAASEQNSADPLHNLAPQGEGIEARINAFTPVLSIPRAEGGREAEEFNGRGLRPTKWCLLQSCHLPHGPRTTPLERSISTRWRTPSAPSLSARSFGWPGTTMGRRKGHTSSAIRPRYSTI